LSSSGTIAANAARRVVSSAGGSNVGKGRGEDGGGAEVAAQAAVRSETQASHRVERIRGR
jgi:hypothetical protein